MSKAHKSGRHEHGRSAGAKLRDHRPAQSDTENRSGHTGKMSARKGAGAAFAPGTFVIVSLSNPREKFWGAVRDLSTAGLSARGMDLNSFDDFVSLVHGGESPSASEVFFPMHRVERVELDQRNGAIPSLAERFLASTGVSADVLLGTTKAGRSPAK